MKAFSALIPVTPTTTCVRAQMTYDNRLRLDEYLFDPRPLFAGFGFNIKLMPRPLFNPKFWPMQRMRSF